MCLFNSPLNVAKVINSKQEKFVVYKVLYKNLESPIYSKVYKVGENKSDSKRSKCSAIGEKITRGIHVYRNLKSATMEIDKLDRLDRIIVKFTAYKKDLLGVATCTMAFSKIYLSQKEYDKHAALQEVIINDL